MIRAWLAFCASLILVSMAFADPVNRTEANNGNLIMEDVPPIPDDIVDSLKRYQHVRSASFATWQADSQGVYVYTRFADVSQLHRVDMPGGARNQITFYDEPIGGVNRNPKSSALVFTRDAGGSEFSQIFRLDPVTGVATMLTDGESRNGAVLWDRDGGRIAYQSTARNGASNDIWVMNPEEPDSASIILNPPTERFGFRQNFPIAVPAYWPSITSASPTPVCTLSISSLAATRCFPAVRAIPASTIPSRSTMLAKASGC